MIVLFKLTNSPLPLNIIGNNDRNHTLSQSECCEPSQLSHHIVCSATSVLLTVRVRLVKLHTDSVTRGLGAGI